MKFNFHRLALLTASLSLGVFGINAHAANMVSQNPEDEFMECAAAAFADCMGMDADDPETNAEPDFQKVMECLMQAAQVCMDGATTKSFK